MRRLSVLIAIAALFVVALPIASVGAAPPEGVTFTGGASFAGTGDFLATGPAVVSGAVCGAGTTTDVPGTLAMSGQSPNGTNMRIVKEFTCTNGPSGSFFVKLRVRIHNPGDTTFKWVIKGGTGAYANLKGTGTGFGTPLTPVAPDFYDVLDTYTGKLH